MSKRVFRFFFDFLDGQERWLNRMAEKGWRLTACGKAFYAFEPCGPGEYEYAVEFVGEKSYAKAKDYRAYLEGMGLRTFTKNINLNYSLGKVKWRPYGDGLGQLAASPGAYNRELLIVEKKRDARPLELHTDVRDKREAYLTALRAYAWAVLMMLLLLAVTFITGSSGLSAGAMWAIRAVLAAFSALYIIPTVKYAVAAARLKNEGRAYE